MDRLRGAGAPSAAASSERGRVGECRQAGVSEASEGRFDRASPWSLLCRGGCSPSLALKTSTDAHWNFLEMVIFNRRRVFEQERHGWVFKPRWGPSGKRLSQGHRVS